MGNLRLLAGMCDVDQQNGPLLMPGTRASVFVNGEAAQMNNTNEEEGEDIQIFPGGLSPGPRHDNDESNDFGAADDNASFGVGGGGNEDWGGDDNDGVGFQLNNDEPMEDAGNVNDEETKDEEETAANAMKKDKPKSKVVQDPWALLDLHEPSKDKPAPLRIGVTTRLPPELDEDDRPSAAVTGSRTRTRRRYQRKR